MGFDLKKIQKGVKASPRKFLIYGDPKIGKSTLVGSTRNALMIPTEDRVNHIDCDKTEIPKKMEDVFEVIQFLATDKTHKYKRLIIDTIDWLEPLIHNWVCHENGFKSITDDHNKETAFQKGLKYHAVSGWKNLLEGLDFLRNSGIDVILVAHSSVIKIDPPDGSPYDKSVMKIDKHSLSVVEEWADIIGYYAREVFVNTEKGKKTGKATTSNRRILHLSGNAVAFISGNSFGLDDIDVDLDHAQEQMEYILTYSETKNEKQKEKRNG